MTDQPGVQDSVIGDSIRVVAFSRAKPHERENVERAVLACVGSSRAEDGNLAYDAHVDSDDDPLLVVVESWADAAARSSHLASEHFKELIRQVDESGRLSFHEFHVLRLVEAV